MGASRDWVCRSPVREKGDWYRPAEMKQYRVKVYFKSYSFTEEYECSEDSIEEIVKEFKAMKPKRVEVFCI